MKMFFITILSLLTTAAAAQDGYIDPEFDPCLRIQGFALLNRDNHPYWAAEPSDPEDVLACYSVMRRYAQVATESQLLELQNNLGDRVRIFNTDEEFQQYLSEQNFQPQMTPPDEQLDIPGFTTFNPFFQTEIYNGLWLE